MRLMILTAAVALTGCAGMRTRTDLADPHATYQATTAPICLLAGAPPDDVRFTVLAHISASKRSYGGTDEVERAVAAEGRHIGADAVIDMQTTNRFRGPLPWRVTAPTGGGTAVKLTNESPSLDCSSAGGHLL